MSITVGEDQLRLVPRLHPLPSGRAPPTSTSRATSSTTSSPTDPPRRLRRRPLRPCPAQQLEAARTLGPGVQAGASPARTRSRPRIGRAWQRACRCTAKLRHLAKIAASRDGSPAPHSSSPAKSGARDARPQGGPRGGENGTQRGAPCLTRRRGMPIFGHAPSHHSASSIWHGRSRVATGPVLAAPGPPHHGSRPRPAPPHRPASTSSCCRCLLEARHNFAAKAVTARPRISCPAS